ncbi:phospholipase D-like domain-containing protein [Marinitoga lauensis]|uniref:phospholipase D-like domain-containing protein n=1 Tax=Marinitoga lauensis TaxID=2201189 RepID=UPI001F0E87E5|nr:phospholipase D-like domain-containing protein [Marinitoga lauensis]
MNSTKKYLYVFSFSFTDGRILYDLEKLSSKNIEIKVIADSWNEKYFSNIRFLKGIEFKIINNYRNMHLKLLINEKGILLGSYNLTYRAREKNDEYLIAIYNENIRNLFVKIAKNFFIIK